MHGYMARYFGVNLHNKVFRFFRTPVSGFAGVVAKERVFEGLTTLIGETGVQVLTAGNATYTGTQLVAGLIFRDPNGADRSDKLPTSTAIRNAMNQYALFHGSSFRTFIRNVGNEYINITATDVNTTVSSGESTNTVITVAPGQTKELLVHVSNKTTPTVMVYGLGSAPGGAKEVMSVHYGGSAAGTGPDTPALIDLLAAATLVSDAALAGFINPDFPRTIQVDIDNNVAGGGTLVCTVTLVGVTVLGETATETYDFDVASAANETWETNNAYLTITSITVGVVTGTIDVLDTISVGSGNSFGLPGAGNPSSNFLTDVLKACADSDDEATGAVVGAFSTINPTTNPNTNHWYDFFYTRHGG